MNMKMIMTKVKKEMQILSDSSMSAGRTMRGRNNPLKKQLKMSGSHDKMMKSLNHGSGSVEHHFNRKEGVLKKMLRLARDGKKKI